MSDFIVREGTDSGYAWPVYNTDGTDFDLAGWTAKVQVRSIMTNRVLHEWSVAKNNIAIVGNEIIAKWSNDEVFDWSGGKYDVKIYSPTNKEGRIDKGFVSISKAVSN